MKKTPYALLALLAVVIPATCQENPVSWSATCLAANLHAGQNFSVKVSARITSGWHIYSITQPPGGPVGTEITVPAKQPFVLAGYVIGPLPKSSYDLNFQIQTESYERAASFKVPLVAAKDTPIGANSVLIDVRFQPCSDRQCLPAKTVHLKAPITITSKNAAKDHKQ